MNDEVKPTPGAVAVRVTVAAPAAAVAAVAATPGRPTGGASSGYGPATLCFVIWGTVPLFWSLLAHVGADEILVHRVLWSGVFTLALLLIRREGRALWTFPWRRLGWVVASAAAVSANWGIYIWAVNAGRVVETSLGYFLSPLVMAGFGVIFFQERLRPARTAALVLAGAGVANLVLRQAGVPWVALGLCLTWGIYSVLRKRMALNPLVGMVLETAVLAPLALGWATVLAVRGTSQWAVGDARTNLLLAAGGLVTAVPLVAFAEAARRMPLTGLAFLQFLTPTLTFILGLTVFGEAFDRVRLVTFLLIWAGVAVFIVDAVWSGRRRPV